MNGKQHPERLGAAPYGKCQVLRLRQPSLAIPGGEPEHDPPIDTHRCALSLAIAGTASAAPITVVNHSFEDISGEAPFNEYTFGPPNGWGLYESFAGQTSSGDGPEYYIGTLTPTGRVFIPGGAPHGNRVGIAYNTASTGNGGEYGLIQTITTDQLLPFTTYTLQVDIINIASGTAVNLAGFPGYRIDLMAGGVAIASDNNTLAGSIPEGGFATSTIIFETGATRRALHFWTVVHNRDHCGKEQ